MSRFGESSSFFRVKSNKTNPPKTHNFLFNLTTDVSGRDETDEEQEEPINELVRFSTESIEVSPFEIQTEEFTSSSVTIPYASGIDFRPITIGFTEQTNYRVLKFLESWKTLMFNLINDNQDISRNDVIADTVNPIDAYTANAELDLAEPNQENDVPAQIQLIRIFPSNIEPVTYDYQDDGEKVDYQVEFAVQRISTNRNP